MRTTLTIDDDVAVALERLRRSRDIALKALINDALRRGLKDMTAAPKRDGRFRTQSVSLGPLQIASIENIGEALALAEGDAFK